MSFERAIAFVLEHEGGLVDNPNDGGKLTKFGISQAAYPDLDIRALTVVEAMSIYRRDYWRPVQGDRLAMGLDIAMLDFAVHSGVRHAVKALQGALGLHVDGVVGPVTLAAINKIKKPRPVALDVTRRRVQLLCRLVKQKPSQLTFIEGWMARTHALVAEIVSVT